MPYHHVVLGGTFDRLHKGHRSDLKTAFELADHVTIGLTTEALHKNKKLHTTILPFEKRKSDLAEQIKRNWPDATVEIVPISDPYGPSIEDPTMEALVVTKETYKTGEKINELRKKNGLSELKIIKAPWILADDGQDLSSTRIRAGEVDREGFVYNSLFEETRTLPEALRYEFRSAPGPLFEGEESQLEKAAQKAIEFIRNNHPFMTVAVGDIVSKSLEESGYTPDIKIIDNRTRRHSIKPLRSADLVNEPATISRQFAPLMRDLSEKYIHNKNPHVLTVDGEEDLLFPAALLLAPLDSIIFFGQPGKGIAAMEVTEETKAFIRSLVEQFE